MSNTKSKSPNSRSRSGGSAWHKSRKAAIVGGVCAGLARSGNMPAWAWRLIFTVGLLFFGLTAFAYVILFFLMRPDPEPAPAVEPLFRKVDWVTFGLTTALVFIGYYLTLAPDLTLEDSGELAVGSHYAGVPHPPGYPVWTLYTWLFTVLVPFSNIAWRVALSSAVAGALSSGLIALLASRGTSLILEGIEELKEIDRRWENALCIAAGYVAGMLIAFNGFMWSQAVIVEVYTLSALSLTGVLCCLLRWIHAQHQRRYLFWALFLFGICFTNHQTLIVAAMGLEVMIALANPRVGRDLFLWNSIVFLLGIFLHHFEIISTFSANPPLFWIFVFIGLSSIAAYIWLAYTTTSFFGELWTGIALGLFYLLGAGFYFYMPLASMTNPPMNWGYPRTWEGFMHALTRGQYERANPTSDPLRFLEQLRGYFDGAIAEFNVVYLLIGLIPLAYLFFRLATPRERKSILAISAAYGFVAVVLFFLALYNPNFDRSLHGLGRFLAGIFCGYVTLLVTATPFVFFRLMNQPERAWIGGLCAIWFCLAVILLVILNPQPDRQSQELNRVFFTASHVLISLLVGYGISITGALVFTHYERYRSWALYGSAIAAAIALYAITVIFQSEQGPALGQPGLFNLEPSQDPLVRFTAGFSLALAALTIVLLIVARQRAPITGLLIVFFILPGKSILSHWSDNEQRGHLFGYWFGHDMFTPPFGVYPPMARDAILFGGTDPGRFAPTYMIFSESFVPPRCKRDPEFDRRDVYIITQNALADGTYLNYIRAHYFRSDQNDPPFFRSMFYHLEDLALGYTQRTLKAQGLPYRESSLSRFVSNLYPPFRPLDTLFTNIGSTIEARRRRNGVYPPKEIYTPSPTDHARCMQEYFDDAQKRLSLNQLRPGEQVRIGDDGRLQVSGQVSVMAINGLLTQVIFERNPGHEFYVEESFALDWMYPYLEPFGIIMKINRERLPEITEEMVRKDHEFWSQYSDRLIGNWITYDTTVQEICDFALRVYDRRNYKGFTGDRKFIRDDQAQKSFSKLRSSIGGLYAWRYLNETDPTLRDRMFREADFAFRQALAFCPYSPEAVFRFTNLLIHQARYDEALLIAETALRFDRENANMANWVAQLRAARDAQSQVGAARQQLGDLEAASAKLTNAQTAFDLASVYLQMQRTNEALALLDRLLNQPDATATTVLSVANAYAELHQGQRLELALVRLTTLSPESPEAWYDLASVRSILGKPQESLAALENALELSDTRLRREPGASDLRLNAATNRSFNPLRNLAEYQRLLAPR
jgi:tetratricopeptide (TPR) repeat protein/phage shock protein PspC (stress-responsive transcriptional regulator)